MRNERRCALGSRAMISSSVCGHMAEALGKRKRRGVLPGEKTLRHLAEQVRAHWRAALDLVARVAEDGGVKAA